MPALDELQHEATQAVPGDVNVLEGVFTLRRGEPWAIVDGSQQLLGPLIGAENAVIGERVAIVVSQDGTPFLVHPAAASGGSAEFPPGGDPGELLGWIGPGQNDVAWVTGTPGPQGPQGPPGATGPAGATGPQGPQGNPGATGPAGPTGPKGDTGAQGPQGVQGPAGPTGPQGATGSGVTMKGSVPTSGNLPPSGNTQGDAYIVQADDSLWIWDGSTWVSGGSIQGPPGAQGPQGVQGPTGATGPPGAQGPKGDTGATGSQGPTGATGSQGPAGTQGPAGRSMVVYNQPSAPAAAAAGDIWVDTDAPVPIVSNVMTYRQLSALGQP